MSTFGTFADTPFGIKIEGQTITIKLEKTSPTTARISWSIPSPSAGCTSETQSYNGIIVTLDTNPVSASTSPVNGTRYISDPTGDTNLHAGDQIGTALVVGAYYDDKTTTYLDITGLQANTAYYVSGYAVDNVYRYHTEGVHTYSLPYGKTDDPSTAGYQIVTLGVQGTDPTGLVTFAEVSSVTTVADVAGSLAGKYFTLNSPTTAYYVWYTIASVGVDPAPVGKTAIGPIDVATNATAAQVATATQTTVNAHIDFSATVDDTILTITNATAGSATDLTSATSGFVTTVITQGQSSYQFTLNIDGTDHTITIPVADATTYADLVNAINEQIALIGNPVQSATNPNTGVYYYNTTSKQLFQWDGTQHVQKIVLVDATDPSTPTLNDYWYDTANSLLKQWDGAVWQTQTIVRYHEDPTTPQCDDFWFTGAAAYQWNGAVWLPLILHNQLTDPSLPPDLDCPFYWYNTTNTTLYYWNEQTSAWAQTAALTWDSDPTTSPTSTFWFNETSNLLYQWDTPTASTWNLVTFTLSTTTPTAPVLNAYWYNPTTKLLKQWNGTVWNTIAAQVWPTNPRTPTAGELWWDTLNDDLYVWNTLTSAWTQVTSFVLSAVNPAAAPVLTTSDVWYSSGTNLLKKWDGSQWVSVTFINFATDPTSIAIGSHWFNTETSQWYIRGVGVWTSIGTVLSSATDPYTPTLNDYWFDTTTPQLNQWNGAIWTPLSYSAVPLTPTTGTVFFNTTSSTLMEWTGAVWVAAETLAIATLEDNNLVITSTTLGSTSSILITDVDLIIELQPTATIETCVLGADGVLGTPSYMLPNVGDDGSPDEMREMIRQILVQLGHPTVDVELTKEQLEFCVTNALTVLRRHSSSAYKRAVFFLYLKAGQQQYVLSNQTVGFHKIVTVMNLYRLQTSFLGTAEGQGVYGQVLLQHLYQMGTFDLVSYHLVNQYIETLNNIFAHAIMFTWDERSRTLSLHKTFWRDERVLVDATMERTDQDLLTDRWTANWLQRWATAEAKKILAEIRGKYGSLPGAGGGVTLNAGDLRAAADTDFQNCLQQIDDYVADHPEEYGMETQFVLG